MVISKAIQEEVIQALIQRNGEVHRHRIEIGVRQVAARWHASDGSADDFHAFCRAHFYPREEQRELVFQRFLSKLESLFGNLHRIYRELHRELHVDTGPMLPIDSLFAGYDPFAHVQEDLFQTRLAFVALLNFPIYDLNTKNQDGINWSRRQWAEARLADYFRQRIPASVLQHRTATYTRADEYISKYNIHMDRLRVQGQPAGFPEGQKLISHWGLRDEIKALYAQPDGLPRQRLIYQIMNRILQQDIPEIVIDNPEVEWDPLANRVYRDGKPLPPPIPPEGNRRYQYLKSVFDAERGIDAHTPDTPSLIERRFLLDREIPEAEVERLITDVLSAPVLPSIARIIQQRLGRPLEPFDIWYVGLKPEPQIPEEDLDRQVRQQFPTVGAFQDKLVDILRRLGFSRDRAEYLAARICVEPARGAGHALGAEMRGDRAYLRTRVPGEGMNYKGFNTAMHELGHTVEQVLTLEEMDYYTLHGVPNTGFTEAFAFLFQSRDFEVLGISPETTHWMEWLAIHEMWSAFEIAGVALVDMRIWRWMYAHPSASPDDLKLAVLEIAREVWNQYFAPVLGVADQEILAIYSHIIDTGMYIPDYLLGHLIAYQIFHYMQDKDLAAEMERMCKLGRLTPQVWMHQAIGEPISADRLIQSATEAVRILQPSLE
ncbi:MAG: hypothetical protein GXO78_04030 [Calditrichaeota bacterium]|nr:hypothetical protein [Calditrichota bacterium]